MSRPNGHALLALALSIVGGCRFPATEVTVELDTDAPRDRPLDIRVTVVRGTDINVGGHSAAWGRDAEHPTATLPASFAVVPGADGPRDELVTLSIDARLPRRTASEQDVVFRRLASFRFVPRVGARLPIFLSTRCGAPAVGCATEPCTVSSLCEQSGQTCGDDGSCVSPMTTLIVPGTDAASDAFDASRTDTIDAVIDTGIDVRADSVVEAARDVPPLQDIYDATTGAIGAPCANNADCTSAHCIADANGRHVCTSICASAATCPSSWTCTANVCTPPLVCSTDFAWGDPYGDNSVRLQSTWHLGLGGGSYSFAYVCARDTSVVDLCADSTLNVGGAHASVIGGIGVRSIGGAHTLTINQAAVAPLFVNVDSAMQSTTFVINAPGSDVYLHSVGPASLNLNGAICHNLVVQAGGSINNMGSLNLTGSFMPGGAIPTPPACP